MYFVTCNALALQRAADDTALGNRPVGSVPGIRNFGNTCFVAATLQCINAIPDCRQQLLSHLGTHTQHGQ